eukprot:SAG22_NODE_6490_length_848_cov_1.036048_1_plen_200_part_10
MEIRVRSVCGTGDHLVPYLSQESVFQLKKRLLDVSAARAGYLQDVRDPASVVLLHAGRLLRDELPLQRAVVGQPLPAAQLVMVRKRPVGKAAGVGGDGDRGGGANGPLWAVSDTRSLMQGVPSGAAAAAAGASPATVDLTAEGTEGDSVGDIGGGDDDDELSKAEAEWEAMEAELDASEAGADGDSSTEMDAATAAPTSA